MSVFDSWSEEDETSDFRPLALTNSLKDIAEDYLIAAGAYDGADTYLIYPSEEELARRDQDLIQESIEHFLRSDPEYRDRAEVSGENLRSTMNTWEDRCEIVLRGIEEERGFVTLMEPEARQGGRMDTFTSKCRKILDGDVEPYSHSSM